MSCSSTIRVNRSQKGQTSYTGLREREGGHPVTWVLGGEALLGSQTPGNVRGASCHPITGPPFCCALVAQSCLTLCNAMDYSLPGSPISEISQARILEWIAISFSRVSSQLRDWTHISCIGRKTFFSFTTEPPRKPELPLRKYVSLSEKIHFKCFRAPDRRGYSMFVQTCTQKESLQEQFTCK